MARSLARQSDRLRAAVYARYSTDGQRDASIGDQVEVCRRYAERQGFEVVDVYSDAAQSGASIHRPGYQKLVADLTLGRYDVVLVEALDRLSRRLADTAHLYDRLAFHGIALHASDHGEITSLHVGMMGTISQMYLSDLRAKTWRGQLGRVRDGRSGGGLGYGYRVTGDGTDDRGGRTIEPREAAVVERIFRMYAGGESPRAIARTLNADGIPGPAGRPWIDTTIRGQRDRGTGILNNALYVGRLEWNRCRYVKDPQTGRRVARPNPPEQWEITEVPELRILQDALWQAVKDRQTHTTREMSRDGDGNALNRAHRRKFLLSGLLTCGECGAGYTIMGKDRYGCATHRNKGTCSNSRTIGRQVAEQRVLNGLKDHLLAPDIVATFVETVRNQLKAAQESHGAERRAVEKELAQTETALQRIIDAIETGAWSESLRTRLADLERRKAELMAQLEQPEPNPDFTLHPNLAQVYRRRVAELEAALDTPEIRTEAMETLRGLIERIDVAPSGNLGVDLTLHGDLARLLQLCTAAESERKNAPGGGASGADLLSVVAGAGFEPATFRL